MPFAIKENTPSDFTKLIPTTITYHQENRVWRIAKDVLSVLFLPVGLYRAWHRVVGLAAIPASMREVLVRIGFMSPPEPSALSNSLQTLGDKGWRLQRLTIEADGLQIDATLLIPPNAKKDRWTLYSTGNAEQYEDILSSSQYCEDLFGQEGLNTNVLLFNYPGVGKSGGLPSRSGSVHAYRTLLRWLENEVQAKELIGFGHSIGGGIQGEAIADHPKNPNVRYCFVKDRTFSHLSGVAADLTAKKMPILGKVLSPIAKKMIELSSWNINTVKAALRTSYPEVIIQKGPSNSSNNPWQNAHTVEGDDIIDSSKSLALGLANEEYLRNASLKTQKISLLAQKTLLFASESHNTPLGQSAIQSLCIKVNKNLSEE